MHEFAEKLREGEAWEACLDEHFKTSYRIERVSRDTQRYGIDRIFVDRETGERIAVEYKADSRAAETGNAFIETTSVDVAEKAGWALTSRARWLAYFVPPRGRVIWILMSTVRTMLPEWALRYPTRKAENKGYFTHGVCIPLAELERHADIVMEIE